MKLVIAVVHPHDAVKCAQALTSNGIACTRYDSNGGFLATPNATLLIAIDEDRLDVVFSILRKHAKERVEKMVPAGAVVGGVVAQFPAADVEVGGATVMVLPLDSFERL